MRPTSQLQEKLRCYLSGRLHAFPEAEKQDDDDDDQTEQELPLRQADVVDPAALVEVQDATPARREGRAPGRTPSVSEDGQAVTTERWRRAPGCPALPRVGPGLPCPG